MGPKDNPDSWRDIHQFIAEFPDDEYWSKWKPMVRDFVSALEARGLVELFRIGQGMHTIIFSTLEHHRLASEPRVTLDFNPTKQTVRVAYSHGIGHLLPVNDPHYKKPASEETVPISAAVPSALGYLRRLWSETKPHRPIPDALKAI